MLELLVDLDLPAQRLLHLRRLYHALVELLHRDFYPGGLVHCQLHLAVGAFSELFAFKVELVKCHIGEHLFVFVGLTGHTQLTCLYERS